MGVIGIALHTVVRHVYHMRLAYCIAIHQLLPYQEKDFNMNLFKSYQKYIHTLNTVAYIHLHTFTYIHTIHTKIFLRIILAVQQEGLPLITSKNRLE